ncbi:MAG: PSD1 domain-containing protein [Verrucomicrobiae bacterium]|nr:PSD1 domain-containing protein [Verrucomicrobiae bacterium]
MMNLPPMAFRGRLAPALMLGLLALPFAGAAQDEASSAFYGEKVYPILKARCFECHGGEEKLKGGFRITSHEGLLRGGDLGAAFNGDEPGASLLLDMVNYADGDHQMPPKSKLPDDEIAVLTEWITKHGATYDPALEIEGDVSERRRSFTVSEKDRQWWSYRPLRPELSPPKVSDPAWEENGIDAFILAQLDAAGLKPNPIAEPAVLCRRVFYDLIGLPPTLKEVQRFEAAWGKDSEAAWNELIEDLLARPQYGEKWARHWLDIVRYAESNGFERDNPKPEIWRYRDYVVRAFNEDKPYDQFVIEQIAGDEIAEPTLDSLVATGFHRLMQWDDEPADRKQHVYDVLADDVQVTCEAFLGTTMGCARCHDHKGDPISQKDYYSFMAFYHGITHYRTEGTMVAWATEEEKAKFEAVRKQRIVDLEAKSHSLETEIAAYLEGENLLAKGEDRPLTFVEDARHGGSTWDYTTSKPTPDWREVGFRNKAWTKAKGGFGKNGTPGAAVCTEWSTPEIWMRTEFGLTALPKSLVMEIHHDEDVEVYLNGQLIHEATGFLTDYETVPLPDSALDALQTGRNVLAVHCRQTSGGQYIDLALRSGTAAGFNPAEIVNGKAAKKFGPKLKEHFGRDVVAEWKDLQKQIDAVRQESPGIPVNAVTENGAEAEPLNVQLRGSAHAPGDLVVPGFPAVLGASGNDPKPAEFSPITRQGRISTGRRLALAEWIASPENPLTARVIMNRMWQHHFGRGIAPSTNDLGHLGEAPTHPELLEWLSSELIRRGWSLKAMHRLILNSHAYRMSSAPNDSALAQDPENRLFWRYNMRRLTAEELRDSILAVSGSLNLKTGGNWVFPPLPAEVLATASRPGKGWPISKAKEDHFRRSLYIHVKRSLRHQMLADFDQADTDSPCAVRFSTTVPTQALAMLNSEFVNQQAEILAQRLRDFSREPAEQVREGLALTTQREPSEDEVRQCLNFMGNIKSQSGLDDRAALDRFALLALNLNEFVYLD